MAILTLEQIRAAQDVAREEVEVEAWGGSVVVQGVNVTDGMGLLKQMQDEDGKINPEKATLCAFVVGVVEPKFSEADVEWLKLKSMAAVTKVTNTFLRLSGFDQAAVKEARKN